MKNLLILLCGIFLTSQGNCQKVVGRIVDDAGKPISNVEVFIEGDTILTYSNYLGFFEVFVSRESATLLASHISYEDVNVNVGSKEKIMFSMRPIYRKLPELNLLGFSEERAYDIDSTELYEFDDYIIKGNDTVQLVNNNAQFPGGMKGLFNYIGRQTQYDSLDKFKNAASFVVQFTIDKDGYVKDVITSGETSDENLEMITKVFMEMPKWKPAKQGASNTSQFLIVEIFIGNEIFLVVEESATFVGGMNAFYEYAGKKMVGKGYPKEARRVGIEGKVFIQFIVESDGTIDPKSVEVLKGIGGGCDELALSVIQDSPPWNPGTQRGKAVRQRMVIPIFFKLN